MDLGRVPATAGWNRTIVLLVLLANGMEVHTGRVGGEGALFYAFVSRAVPR